MARVSGPLFSMSASGSIGKAITYGIWKGRPWVRIWFKPENPQSANQTNVRYAMTLIVAHFQILDNAQKAIWDAFAAQFNMSGFNQFVKRGMLEYVSQITTAVTPVSVAWNGESPPVDTWTWA